MPSSGCHVHVCRTARSAKVFGQLLTREGQKMGNLGNVLDPELL